MMKRTRNNLQKQQDKASVNLEKFYEIIGKDRSIIPNTSQTLNLELTLASDQHLKESTLNPQDNQIMETDSWIDDLLYCSEDIDDLVSLQSIDTPETSASQKDKNLLKVEIEEWIEEFVNLPADKP